MDTQHTPEPWRYSAYAGRDFGVFRDDPRDAGHDIAIVRGETASDANARRVVACVNACAGIPTEALEAGVVGEMVAALRQLHDEVANAPDEWFSDESEGFYLWPASEALAKLEAK